jgi:hypothetical protein
MDDGLGFSIGSIFGGFLFQKVGGKRSFQIFSGIALITCIAHILLRPAATHEIRVLPAKPKNVENSNEVAAKVNVQSEEETFEIDEK